LERDCDGERGHKIHQHRAVVRREIDVSLENSLHSFEFFCVHNTDLIFKPVVDFRLGESPFPVHFAGWNLSTYRHLGYLTNGQVQIIG
jgi:hypothetical protein